MKVQCTLFHVTSIKLCLTLYNQLCFYADLEFHQCFVEPFCLANSHDTTLSTRSSCKFDMKDVAWTRSVKTPRRADQHIHQQKKTNGHIAVKALLIQQHGFCISNVAVFNRPSKIRL